MTKIATPQQKSFYSGDPETSGEDKKIQRNT